MRLYLIWFAFLFMCVFTWRDWYKALCFLILSMAIVERPDMPKELLGIPGFNPWNLLFINVVMSATIAIRRDKSTVAMPVNIKRFLYFYLFVVILAFVREVLDTNGMMEVVSFRGSKSALNARELFQEHILNTLKYAVPGILLYFGCNDERRFRLACGALLLMNFLLAVQIIKVMPPEVLMDGTLLEQTAIRKIDRDIGYYRSDLAIFLGGAAWAMFIYRYTLTKKPFYSLILLLMSLLTVYAIALTGGRMGMGGWIAVGVVVAFYRYRRLLVLGPAVVILVVLLIPGVAERFTQGFSNEESDKHYSESLNEGEANYNSITSGRSIIWPYVIDKIRDAPYLGYGRNAMQRVGLSRWLGEEFRQPFPHPHNAYLQLLIDNGILLAVPIFIFYFVLMRYALRLFKEKEDMTAVASGGMGIAFVFSFLVGAMAQQSFYPFIGAVGMWCVIGIMLRVYRDKYLNEEAAKGERFFDLEASQNRSDKWYGVSGRRQNRTYGNL